MYKINVSEKQEKEIRNDEFSSATYINGIMEILFILSMIVSIKFPSALYCGFLVAIIAAIVNMKLITARKNNKENGADR